MFVQFSNIVFVLYFCTSIDKMAVTAVIVFLWMWSDLTVKLKGKELPGHKFVLAARSDYWGNIDLSHVSVLDLSGKILCLLNYYM